MGSAIFLLQASDWNCSSWGPSMGSEWGWSATYDPSLAPRAFGLRFSCEFRFEFWFTVVRVGEPKIWRQGQNWGKVRTRATTSSFMFTTRALTLAHRVPAATFLAFHYLYGGLTPKLRIAGTSRMCSGGAVFSSGNFWHCLQ